VIAATFAGYWLARRFKPDVIHAHFAVPTGAAAWAISRSLHIPYVLTAHLGDVPGGVPEQTDRLFRWILPFTKPIWRDASDTTAVSSFVAGLASEAYGRQPRVIFNGVDLDSIPVPAIDVRSDIPRLIWAGRMQPQKNLLFGLRALATQAELPWHLDLIGDGPQRKEVEALTRELGLSDRIHFHGWLTHEAVQRLMTESSVLFLPSLSEGLPMLAVEALAHGLALLCSRIGGLADVAHEGLNAHICPLEDPTAYANALRELCTHPTKLRNLQHASRQLARKFDLSRIIEEYEKTLRLAAKHKPESRKVQ
jgi:glycosyltransferase involved in cell wall biosynthesis